MRDLKRAAEDKWLHIFEKAAIRIFIATAVIAIAFSFTGTTTTQPTAPDDPSIAVNAYAMPNNGWAPLTVYFSAFGSKSPNGNIIRYEWDLDGNGSFETNASSDGGYAAYTYTKPREYTISVRVTDASGKRAIATTTVHVRHPASSSVDYWSVFDDSRVRKVQITLDQAEWEKMWVDPISKYQARADAVIFGTELKDVGFRMRGQFSLRNSGDKKPFKIDIDAYIEGQEYKNLRQLMFLNSIGDPSLLNEKLAYELMAFSGLPASHVAFTELWIDLRDDGLDPIYWGVYAMVERVDNKYIGNRFTRDAKGGNLYKASHAQRGPMDLVYYGDSIADYPTQDGSYAYGKMNNEEEADYSDIVALCRTINGADYNGEAEYIAALESAINVDNFLRYHAVNMLIDNWDSYINTGNNFYLFNNPVSGRFEWIPWDLTWGGETSAALFTKSDFGMMQGGAPMYDKTMAISKYRMAYTAYLDLLTRYFFTTENMAALIRTYHNQVAPYVNKGEGDKAFFGEEPMFDIEAFQNSTEGLIHFVSERNTFARNEINEELSNLMMEER